jgi:tetratricopeptide (TPR) repeat protein
MGQQTNWEWIGFVYERLKQYENALRCFERSRELIAKWPADKQPRALALHKMNSGRVLVDAGRAAEALPRLHEAKAYFANHGDVVNVAKTEFSIGEAYRALGRLTAAVEVLELALPVLTEQASLAWQASVRGSLAQAYRQLGRGGDGRPHWAEQRRLDGELKERREAVRRLHS